jgi:hypothetical protein
MPNKNDEVAAFGRRLDDGESPAIASGGSLAKHDKDNHDKDDKDKHHAHRHPPHVRSHATIAVS